MYTYGYIKSAILTKMNLIEEEAIEQNIIDSFIYNINECLSQIASTIKPHYDCEKVIAYDEEIPIPEELSTAPLNETPEEREVRETALKEYLSDKILVGEVYRMPETFIAFSGKSYIEEEYAGLYKDPQEIHGEIVYVGNDKLIFLKAGKYIVTYDGSWPYFSDKMLDSEEVDIPTDIIMCLPSYVASQIWKIDDERKAAIFRNEFEILFSRINNSDYRGIRTLGSEGGW